jgi:histidyl-tRNA synthetase
MSALKPIRGTHDILPDEMRRHRFVSETACEISERYGFGEIATPIFESTKVFSRTLGETSDIVTKEMYTFESRGGDQITLRPEGTAGVARAFISNGLGQSLPLKLFYRGPMFRYERPQKGRQRQFHQVGVEVLGVETAQADIEVIAMGAQFLEALGLGGSIKLELNSLGDRESRDAYRETLVDYLSGFKDKLSEDSLSRLERNPMRILDSKDEGDRSIVANAPLLSDSLNDASRAFFDELRRGLEDLGVAYEVSPRLVRGLDYYCHTAFEFTTDALGAQGTVLAGGRYDGLIKQMGGPQTAGIGWAAGVERLSMMIGDEAVSTKRPITLVPMGEAAQQRLMALAHQLRNAGFVVDMGYAGNLKKRLQRGNKANACAAVLLGDDEIARGAATVRDMESGEQTEVAFEGLQDHLAGYR